MSYEEEQAKYRNELQEIDEQLAKIEAAFTAEPRLKQIGFYNATMQPEDPRMAVLRPAGLPPREDPKYEYYRMILRNYGEYDTYGDSLLVLQQKILIHKRKALSAKLKETKTDRRVLNALQTLEDITPQHVSGRVYKVNDGDKFGKFCLWFLIIDAIIIFLYYMFTEM